MEKSGKGTEVLAIIPARGGSKGIPSKNIKLLAGKPLIAWAIEAAKGAKFVTRIIVSTDDEKIAEIAKRHGAGVPFLRPAAISGDLATDVEFLKHALGFLKEKEGYEPEIVVRIPPTSPLSTSDSIDKGIKILLDDPDADSVRPVIEVEKHPYKFWKIRGDGRYLEPFLSKEITGFDEPQNLPRQLFPKVYRHTGSMDVIRSKTILLKHSTSGDKTGFFFVPPEEAVNIDSPADFEIAEFILARSNQRA